MRPRDRRRILNGILWLHAKGVPWRDLPDRYGPGAPWPPNAIAGSTRVSGTQILGALQQRSDAAGQLDWSAHFVDGSVIRAHQHAAGAHHPKGDGAQQALGMSRGGISYQTALCAPNGAASPSPCG